MVPVIQIPASDQDQLPDSLYNNNNCLPAMISGNDVLYTRRGHIASRDHKTNQRVIIVVARLNIILRAVAIYDEDVQIIQIHFSL
jgi:hypothetical protein